MKRKPNRIEKILMNRDQISFEEANEIYRNTASEINEVLTSMGGLDEVEDIVLDNLGLEPDYIEDFLY